MATTRTAFNLGAAWALILTMAGCVEQNTTLRPVPEFDRALQNCKRQTSVPGQYVVGPKGTNGVPVVLAGQGGTLRGEVLLNTCISQNLGTSVAALPAAPQKVAAGKLPLPTQYPLLPGDAELWASLTREQQDRALVFLADGSTIRGSMRTE
jgi:hypothetical protein